MDLESHRTHPSNLGYSSFSLGLLLLRALSRVVSSISVCLLAFCFHFSSVIFAQEKKPSDSAQSLVTFRHYQTEILPILTEYCYECHMDGSDEGGLDLDLYESLESMTAERKTWQHIQEHLSLKLMPPEDKPQPSAEETQKILEWIESTIFAVDPNHPDPGHVTLRRLNATEYENTLRDLLHVTSNLKALLPPDDTGHGFDTIGGALSTSPSHIEKYLNAAETAIAQALQNLHYKNPVKTVPLKRLDGNGLLTDHAYLLMTEGQARYPIKQLAQGKYRIEIRAYSTEALGEHAKMQVQLHGVPLQTFEVLAQKTAPKTYTLETELSDKQRALSIHFLNDYYDPETGSDRNLFIENINIIGPILDHAKKATQVFPARMHSESDNDYAHRVLFTFANKAFRRPVSHEEIRPLLGFLQTAANNGDTFEQGLALALQAILISPDFLFKEEPTTQTNNKHTRATPISEHALATRLSYFLWSTTPDKTLRELADTGQLRAQLSKQVLRMIKDKKFEQFITNFSGQWLKLRDLEKLTPNPQLYPEATLELRQLMREETQLYLTEIFQNNKNLLRLLDSNYTYLNDQLAHHYDIRGIDGPQFRKTTLPNNRRGGIITHASLLSLTSTPLRTSPVLRGQFILENILDTPAPPPPPNIPALSENAADDQTLKLREQLALHRKNPDCAGCHNLMDPIGLAFENYDAIGRWRDHTQGEAIDSKGKLVTGETFQDATELRHILYETKRSEFLHCLISKIMTYSLGRGIEYYDKPTLHAIAKQVQEHDYSAHQLILAICESTPFQMKRPNP